MIAGAAKFDNKVARDEVVDVAFFRVLLVGVDDAAGQLVGAVAQAVPPRTPARGARRCKVGAAEGLTRDVMHVGEGERRGAGLGIARGYQGVEKWCDAYDGKIEKTLC